MRAWVRRKTAPNALAPPATGLEGVVSQLWRQRGQWESLVLPACDAARHDLHQAPQPGQAQRAARGAIAVRASTVGDKKRIHRPVREFALDQLAMWQVDRARHVALGKQGRRPYIEQHEVGAPAKCIVNVPAIGLEREFGGEMGLRNGRGSSRDGSDFGGHRWTP